MKYVYAKWYTKELPEPSEIYISCGIDNVQETGYFLTDEGTHLSIAGSTSLGFQIEFKAPSEGLEGAGNWWLSPSLLNGKDEAYDFGIRIELDVA